LDDRIAEFANHLPPSWKVRGLRLRHFFKEALADFLPPEIIAKRKHGFGLPFGRWLVKYPPLREMAKGSLESMRDRGVVRSGFVDDLLDDLVSGHPTFYGEFAWLMIMLDQWLCVHRPHYRIR